MRDVQTMNRAENQAGDQAVSVIGLGKVGLPLAACLASAGFDVCGFDTNPAQAEMLEHHDPADDAICFEAGLSDHLIAGASRLWAAQDIADAIRNSTMSFIIVPTPSVEDGSFALSYVEAVCTDIAHALRDIGHNHVIVLVSTVSPGSVDGHIVPLLEKLSGKRCGPDFGVCYAPALIALGDVITGFTRPDLAFVGEVDGQGADRLMAFYQRFLPSDTPLHRMRATSVEVAKIALNNFLTMKIGFSNMIGHLCARTADANAQHVLSALGDDKRIGKKFLNAGMGFGGPCLPRDNAALAASFRAAALETQFPDAIAQSNVDHATHLAALAQGHMRACVLGLGYKAASPVTLESASITLCNMLHHQGYKVSAFDPLTDKMDLQALNADVVIQPTLADAVDAAEIIFLTVAPEAFPGLADLLPNHVQLIDVHGGLPEYPERINIIRFGS